MKPFADIDPANYSYNLPDDRIALYPEPVRDESRLLIRYKDGSLRQSRFKYIADFLQPYSTVFFNNSKVIPARLIFYKETGSRIEILCLRPVEPSDYTESLANNRSSAWECMVGNLKRFTSAFITMPVKTDYGTTVLKAEKVSQSGNTMIIQFTWDDDRLCFATLLSLVGVPPLPPYIKRETTSLDHERYQTIYSKFNGSVAAPTAGLHFTDEVFKTLAQKHIMCREITLHVGAGTFQPIKANRVVNHKMHAELFMLTPSLLKTLISMPSRVTCVGTTTVRTLESIYWLGVKTASVSPNENLRLHLDQWEPYQLPADYSIRQSFEALGDWMEKHHIAGTMASTSLMIMPGYRFNVVDALITNFHQPRSTLLLLIAAFIGDTWKDTYNYALKEGFRFLSYGDSSLLYNPDS